MDRGLNREGNYLTQEEFIQREAAKRVAHMLPGKSPMEIKKIVHAIFQSQFKEALYRLRYLTEVDIAAFGTYQFRITGAKRYLKKYEKSLIKRSKEPDYPTEKDIREAEYFEKLKKKLDQFYEWKNHKRVPEAPAKNAEKCEQGNRGDSK